MKKLMIVLVVLMVTVSAAFADRVVSEDSLPQTAKDLIAQYFPGKSVMYAEADFNEYVCKAAVSGCSDYPGRKRLAQHRIKAVKQNGTVF